METDHPSIAQYDDSRVTAESHGTAPAIINMMGLSEDAATRLANALYRNGMIVGAVGAAFLFVTGIAIVQLNRDESSHTLCAYEFNRFTAEVDAGKDVRVLAPMIEHSGCKAK